MPYGDWVATRIRANLGLDRPLYVQYFKWLGLAIRGDFGYSITNHQPVSTLIKQRLPQTLVLMITSEIVIIVFSVLLGIYSAVKQYSLFDNVLTGMSFIGYSLPIFFVALMLMFIFAVQFKEWGLPYLPTGADIWDFKDLGELAVHLVLPVASLAVIQIAAYTRYLRSSMLEVLSQDYIRTARAKGLSEKDVVVRHALRGGLMPVVSYTGPALAFLLTGTVVVERIFALPGLGNYFIQASLNRDEPLIIGIVAFISITLLLMNLLVDIAYAFLDPRVRY